MAIGVEVTKYIISINRPTSKMAIGYQSMYEFGNHLQMASVERHLSCLNLGVATMFEQKCRSHLNDKNPVVASLEYVG
jgi:hypothetical protein